MVNNFRLGRKHASAISVSMLAISHLLHVSQERPWLDMAVNLRLSGLRETKDFVCP